jgi:DNA-binding NtrC family response regulator
MPEQSQPTNVLIVEDNVLALSLAKATISLMPGFRSEEVTTLDDALLRLAQPGVDVVLLDLNLPDASGMEAIHKIQKFFPAVPMAVITGDGSMFEPCVRAGVQEFITKPAEPETVARALRYAIIRHQVRPFFRSVVEASRELGEAIADLKQIPVPDGKSQEGSSSKAGGAQQEEGP